MNCKNRKMTDEYCASGDCQYDTLKEYEAHGVPVPSYEEYISLINWKEDLTEICTVKERIIEKYENIDTWCKAECAELKVKNAQLKELLKECEKSFQELSRGYEYGIAGEISDEMIAKIEEALR